MKTLLKLCEKTFSIYVCFAILLVLFVTPCIARLGNTYLDDYNVGLFAMAIVMGLLICLIGHFALRSKAAKYLDYPKVYLACSLTGLFVLLAIQFVLITAGWFKTGWDVIPLTAFDDMQAWISYYSTYPNQLFLSGLFAHIASMGEQIGFENGYLLVTRVGGACAAFSVFFLSFIARQLFGPQRGAGIALFAAAFIGLSPWIFVPYSDVYAMTFTTLALFAYTIIRKPQLKWPLILASAIIGYAIKPTVIFAPVAIALVSTFNWMANESSRHLDRQSLTCAATTLLGSILSLFLATSLCTQISRHIDVNPEAAFSATHFLMMGFNEETQGRWSADDYYFSEGFDTKQERTSANIERWLQRVSTMGPSGVGKLLTSKTIHNYGDGTFAWECEGEFYRETFGPSELVKSFYGIDDGIENERAAVFAPIAQVAWFIVLIGVCLFGLVKKPAAPLTACALALLMLSVFLMLFESRARYLFLYLPYFLLLGCAGWSWLSEAIQAKCGFQPIRSQGRHFAYPSHHAESR